MKKSSFKNIFIILVITLEERERKLKEINDRIDKLITEMEEEREKRFAERWAKRHPERNKAENIKNT